MKNFSIFGRFYNSYFIGNNQVMISKQSRLDSVSILSRQSDLATYSARMARYAAMILCVVMVGVCSVWGENATITIGTSSSTSYAATFTSSSSSANITASATAFTKGGSTTSSNSTYSSATAPYSIKFKPSSNINTSVWSDNYSVSAQFTIASGYIFAPSAISATIVTEAPSYTYQAILTDGVTTYTSLDLSSSANGTFTFSFPSLSGDALSGTVTFKVRYKSTANNSKFFVINLPITITGVISSVVSCTAPTGLAVGSITGTSAAFTVTDAEDTNDYEFYYSTSSTAPTASTAAMVTSTSKTKVVTDLTANTTYYAWVRSKCNASNKSAWVAASSFNTLAASTWDLRGTMNGWSGGSDVFYGSGTVIAAVTLSANTDYEFKIVDSGSTWYGNNGKIGGNISNWNFSTSEGNCHLLTTTAGTYTFSFNTSTHALTITYPDSYKVYYKNTNSWGTIKIYKFTQIGNNTGNAGDWPGATVSTYEEICGDRYYYAYTEGYKNVIFTDGSGHQTGDMPSASGDGMYVTGTGDSWNILPNCHSISFNMNGHGSVVSSIYVEHNTSATEPSPWPDADGYNFGGWYTDAGCTNAVDWSENITEDKTYYAKWTEIPAGLIGKYSLHTGNAGGYASDWTATAFTQVGSSTEWRIENYEIPSTTHLYVGYQGAYKANDDASGERILGTQRSGSNTVAWADAPDSVWTGAFNQWQGQVILMPFSISRKFFAVGQATGAKGALQVYHDSNDKNLYINFTPSGYGIKFSDGTKYAFTNTSSNIYETDVVEVPDVSKTFFVGLKKEGDDYAKSGHSPVADAALNTIKIESTSTGISNDAVGKFRMWNNSYRDNWNVQFVPCYVLRYDANGGTGTTEKQYVETNAANKIITLRANGFTPPAHKHFVNWGTTSSGGTAYVAGATYTLNSQVTLYAQWEWDSYTVTLHTNSGTINSGNVTSYTYGEGATLPADVTRDNYTFAGWYENSSCTGSVVTEISTSETGNKEYWAKWISCPEVNSGDIVYKFVTKSSGLGTENVCAAINTDYDLVTPSPLSTLIGGTLTARCSGSSTNLKYHNDCFDFNGGANAWLKVTLDCPIDSGDFIRYVNNNSGSIYVRHTSKSTSDDQFTLSGNSMTNVQTTAISAAFVGETELYLVRNSNTSYISYFEIIRSCPLTLDAGTNGGTVEGNATKVIRAANDDVLSLPHAIKDGYRFKGWFVSPSGGDPVSDLYTIIGATTLYAQFEDCPHDGVMYKFEVGTGLTNGSVTENGVAFNFNMFNHLTGLVGGTLTTAGSKASYIKIVGTNAVSIEDNGAYLKVELDCEIEDGDMFKATVAGNTVFVSKTLSRANTATLPTGTLQETVIPAALVGEKTLYLWRGGGTAMITYFEITRPKRTNIMLSAPDAYNKYTTSVVATYNQGMPEISDLPMRVGYVFGGYYDGTAGTGTQYYNGLGESVRNWDKDVITSTLYAYWIEPCNVVPTLKTIVPTTTIWDGVKVDMSLVQLLCDFDTTGITYSLLSASDAIAGCTFSYFDEKIYIQGTPVLGNVSTVVKTIVFTLTNDCSPASTYEVTATIRIYPAGQKAKIAYIVTGTKGGSFDAYSASDVASSSSLLSYLAEFYDITCVNGYATKDSATIASYYDQYDLLIVTDYMETPEGYTNAIGTLIDKKPILSFEAYVAGEHGSNWHIGSNPKDPSPKVKDMKILCAGHAIFQDAEGVDVINDADTTVHVLESLSGESEAKGLQGFVINEAPDFIFLATIRDASHNRNLIVSCERQVVFQARLLLYGINFYEMGNLSNAGKVVMHQMIRYLLMMDETKVADCSLVFDNGVGNIAFDAGTYSGTGVKGDGLWSTAANWSPGYNIVPTPFHPTRIIAECHVNNDDAHAGSVKVNKGKDEHGNPVDGKLIIEPEGGLTIAGLVTKVNDTRYASPITIKAEDLLIKANATHNGAFVFGNKESDVRATVEYYSRGDAANSVNPTWQYMGIPFQANKTAISMYRESWMCRWTTGSTDGLGGLWQWVDNNDVLIPFEGYCITQAATKTYTNNGKLNAPITKTLLLDNRDTDGFAFAANSWTAPIKIQEMQDADFTNAERAIYIYHSGSFEEWSTNGDPVSAVTPGSAATLPGQYAVIPIHASPYLAGADSVIPAMQGFFIQTTNENATLQLVYNRVVYDATYFKTSTQPMRAPCRTDNEPEVMALFVSGESLGGDRVHLLVNSDFSDGYNDGWDGRKLEGDAAVPMLAIEKEAGKMAVAAIPTIEERELIFRAGNDSIYTFNFNYDGETFYLYDRLTTQATLIKTGNSYTFEARNKTAQPRFLITAYPPKIPTEIENVGTDLTIDRILKYLDESTVYIIRHGVVYDVIGRRVTPYCRREKAQ